MLLKFCCLFILLKTGGAFVYLTLKRGTYVHLPRKIVGILLIFQTNGELLIILQKIESSYLF
jgi:hypothetical protein